MKTQLLHDFAESGSAPGDAGSHPASAASTPVAVPAAAAVSASDAAPTQPAQARRRPVADLLLQRATDAAQFDAARSRQRTSSGNAASAGPAPDLAAPDAAHVPADPMAAGEPLHIPAAAEAAPAHSPAPVPPADAGPAEPFFSAAPEAATIGADAVAAPDVLPAWLDERLRADRQRDAGRERRGRWMRRALAGGATAALLALLAGAGWWMVQDNRVDGALTAVANTSAPARKAPVLARTGASAGTPAGAGEQAEAGAQAGTGALAGARDGAGPAAQAAPAPADVPPAAGEAVESAPPDADSRRASSAAAPSQHADPARRAVRKRQAAVAGSASAPGRANAGNEAGDEAGDDAGAGHRREETLLQCRALGYDEGQCLRRGCAMTRFGLACRG